MTHVFRDRADFEANVGFCAWPSPSEDMENGFLHVAVSTPPVRLPDVAVADPRCVKLPEEQIAINFISYDTKARCVTLRLSLARFNSSKTAWWRIVWPAAIA